MDGDLQDRPEVIPRLLLKAQEGFDVVFVSRVDRPESFTYLLSQKLFYKILRKLSGLNLNSKQANFSIISRKGVDAFLEITEKSRFYPAIIMWLGFERAEIFAKHGKRYSGKPSYSIMKRIKLATDIIVAYSIRPLYFPIILGAISNLIFLIVDILFKKTFVTRLEIENNYNLMNLITYFNLILIFIIFGVFAFYFHKLLNEVRDRPLYVISAKV